MVFIAGILCCQGKVAEIDNVLGVRGAQTSTKSKDIYPARKQPACSISTSRSKFRSFIMSLLRLVYRWTLSLSSVVNFLSKYPSSH